MVASNPEQAKMRFEAAPTGGPRTVYAGYVLDNIEGRTHTDSEYGVMAFDSASGRVQWRTPLCRLQPGKFLVEPPSDHPLQPRPVHTAKLRVVPVLLAALRTALH